MISLEDIVYMRVIPCQNARDHYDPHQSCNYIGRTISSPSETSESVTEDQSHAPGEASHRFAFVQIEAHRASNDEIRSGHGRENSIYGYLHRVMVLESI